MKGRRQKAEARKRTGNGAWPVVAGLLVTLLVPSVARAQKLVYLVRHAERADLGVGGMPTSVDPDLSSIGHQRAAKLADMLADAGITSIFVTELVRTQQTAAPLAKKLKITPEQVVSRDPLGLVRKLREQHANDIVLIVSHSNAMPEIIKAYGGPVVTIPDPDYDNLFVIVPASATVSRITFKGK